MGIIRLCDTMMLKIPMVFIIRIYIYLVYKTLIKIHRDMGLLYMR